MSYCHEDFLEVKRIFNHNFDKYKEIGSSLCVIVDGEIVVVVSLGTVVVVVTGSSTDSLPPQAEKIKSKINNFFI